MQKKGIGHIEVVLSFVLFMTAILSIFYFFSPINSSDISNSALSYSFNSLIEKSSSQIDSYGVIIKAVSGEVAISIPVGILGNSYSKDFDGNTLKSKREGNLVYVESMNKDFFYLEISEDFDASTWSPTSPPAHEADSYSLGPRESKRLVSEKNILALNSSYYSDYSGLKEDLDIPNNVNFAFGLFFLDGRKITAERSISGGTEVYTKSEKVEVINKLGGVSFAELIVRIW